MAERRERTSPILYKSGAILSNDLSSNDRIVRNGDNRIHPIGLNYTNLQNTNLQGANLRDTNLSSPNLRCVNLTGKIIENIIVNENTIINDTTIM